MAKQEVTQFWSYFRLEGHEGTDQANGATLVPSCEVREDDLLQGRVNRIWHHVVRYADCIDDLGDLEISRPSGNGFFQPDGSDESLCAFLRILGFHHCAVRCGFRTVRIFPEEMNPSARLR